MLHLNVPIPKKAGDVELGAGGTLHDLELVRDGNHMLFNASSTAGFTLLGMMASHGVSEPRIASPEIEATFEDTLEIIKPVVDEVGEKISRDGAVWFARGVFHGLRVDFPDFALVDEWERHELFQTLTSGVSEEAAAVVRLREDSNEPSPSNS